jgi:hypothetical protein
MRQRLGKINDRQAAYPAYPSEIISLPKWFLASLLVFDN